MQPGRFSFLLSTPAITAAAAKALYDLHKQGGIAPDMRVPFLVGMIVSAVVGCFVIALFLRFLRAHSLKFFILLSDRIRPVHPGLSSGHSSIGSYNGKLWPFVR